MIVIRLIGGLGNQMFQYALGKALALKNDTKLILDLTLLEDHSSMDQSVVHRNFDLDIFSVNFDFASTQMIEYFNGKNRKTYFGKAFNRIRNILTKNRLIIEKDRFYNPQISNLIGSKCLVGSWQSPNYFESFRETLLKEFTFKAEYINLTSFSFYQDQIKTSINTVGLHVRRGDYVTNRYYNELLGVLPKSFYTEAIELLKKKFKKMSIFVFSDDIKWCEQNLEFEFITIFIANEKSKKGVASDMKLMSLCEHQIISNSSFAWWAAWLNKNDNKKVIAPKSWVNSKHLNDPQVHAKDIIPDSWIQI